MSVFLPREGALFLHVPRTGGRWISECMEYSGVEVDSDWAGRASRRYFIYNHALLAHCNPNLVAQVKYVFAFVRHPVDLYVSFWRVGKSSIGRHPNERRPWKQFTHPLRRSIEGVYRWKPDFDEWLEEMLEEEPAWVTRLFERFVGPPGAEFCHFIGRTETLEEDMNRVMDILGRGSEWTKFYREVYPNHPTIRTKYLKAPTVVPTEDQRRRIERSERVAIRRFFGEGTKDKRVYREKDGKYVR